MILEHGYRKDQCTDKTFEKEALELYGCTTPFGPNKNEICVFVGNHFAGSRLS